MGRAIIGDAPTPYLANNELAPRWFRKSVAPFVRLVLTVSDMPHWVRVAELAEHPPGSAWECAVEDRILALFHVEGGIFALDGFCPHQGGPLGKGCLTGATVTCPWHGWQFDVRTGQSLLSRTIRQPTYRARIEEGGVWVDLHSGGSPGDDTK